MLDHSIIIPAVHPGYRMKSYGPKSLIALGNDTVIIRQLRILSRVYPNSEIIIVLGFEADKVRKELELYDYNYRIVIDKTYEHNNIAHSIHLGIENANDNSYLIVYGDMVFTDNLFDNFKLYYSEALVGNLNKQQVGVTIVDGYISVFSYGLPTKWLNIVYLSHDEAMILKQIVKHKSKHKLFGFELLNQMIDAGGILKAIELHGCANITKVENLKDVELAKSII